MQYRKYRKIYRGLVVIEFTKTARYKRPKLIAFLYTIINDVIYNIKKYQIPRNELNVKIH